MAKFVTLGYKHHVPTIDPVSAPRIVKEWLDLVRPEIDATLARYMDALAADGAPPRLHEAMRYAVLGPGKRLRPALVLAACVAVGQERDPALPAAAAVEFLHAYTLVHDDLPAMDDDAMRRGRPSVHIEFGEAMAILAGDSLLTAAFAALSDLGANAGAAVAVLAHRAGASQLIAGQVRDMSLEGGDAGHSLAEIETIHAAKTGALFSAAAELGAIAGGASLGERARLARYGMAIGIAFQHADDRDDDEFAEHRDVARQRMKELTEEAENLSDEQGPNGRILSAIAGWMKSRA